MKRQALLALPFLALLLVVGHAQVVPTGSPASGSGATPDKPEKKFEDFDKVVKGAKEIEGLFRLYRKDDNLFAEILPTQLDKPFLLPIAIARGSGLGGFTLNFDEQWVVLFKRVGDRVQLVRRNVRFTAKSGTPEARAVETTYTDSILLALPIKAINMGRQSLLINLNDIFMSDFAQLGMGNFDANRSSWHKVKAFPRNVELQVAATFSGGRAASMFGGDSSVIDSRGVTVVVHYGLCELPSDGYTPRLADDRVGYFLSAVKDFSNDTRDDSYVRYVNRWRLERAEPVDPKRPEKLSAPKKKIVFWIENTVPDEYRAYVREGILEWNKAFEKVGFRDAIEVRQQESEEFDPEDITYNTFRWITTDAGFAMGPSRANPLTGELLDADIIFDASMVRFWKQEYHLMHSGTSVPSRMGMARTGRPLLDGPPDEAGAARGWNLPRRADAETAQQDVRPLALRLGLCQCASHMKYELAMAALAAVVRDQVKPGEKVPEELIGQAVKHVVMHEVGHTLGLRHNFKASSMLKNEQLHDTAITRKQGIVGSVMDYAPVNLAPKGTKQGDYFSVVLGPYDYWAIEYAYKPLTGGTAGEREELKKIAQKGATPGHDFGTDEDLWGTSDPTINVWDLGADPMKFGQDRLTVARELFKGLSDRVVDNGDGYQKVRMAFTLLLMQYADAAWMTASYVGGEHAHRDHRGDPNGRDPFVPVKADKQREGLKWLQDNILTDKHFQFPPELLRRLAADRWWHWGTEWQVMQPTDYPLNQRILSIQSIALQQLLSPQVLRRVQDVAAKVDKGEKALTVAEIFRALSDAVWLDLSGKDGKKSLLVSVVMRNLQREHLNELTQLVVGGRFGAATPPDARSLARMHLRQIDRQVEAVLNDKKLEIDDATRAHLEECHERITRVLTASMQVNQP